MQTFSVLLDTYQGAEVTSRSAIDWNACMMRFCEGLVQPKIWMAYAHMGQINLTTNSNLFSEFLYRFTKSIGMLELIDQRLIFF